VYTPTHTALAALTAAADPVRTRYAPDGLYRWMASPARWEDYTQTAIDRSDDCTIWYVGDYVKKGAPTYSTRIASVRLPGCMP
jgi:hypothetical protein